MKTPSGGSVFEGKFTECGRRGTPIWPQRYLGRPSYRGPRARAGSVSAMLYRPWDFLSEGHPGWLALYLQLHPHSSGLRTGPAGGTIPDCVGGQCLSEGPCLTQLAQEPSVRECANPHAFLVSNPSLPYLSTIPWCPRTVARVGTLWIGFFPCCQSSLADPPYFRSTASKALHSVSHEQWPSG
jgi:hypothetical protein